VAATALRYRWYIFWIFAIQYLLLFFHRVCPAVLAPELTSAFNISGAALGLLASAYFYPYALMQVPVGMLSDSWGARKTATLFGSLAGVGVILFGLAPTFSLAVFSRVLIGLGLSAVFVPAMKVFAAWYRGKEYARVSGFFVGIGSIGWLIGATPLALLSQLFDWRWVFIAIGIITIAVTILTWLVVADAPEKKGFAGIIEQRGSTAGNKGGRSNIRMILCEWYFWPLATWFFWRVSVLFGFFGLWAGPYLMDVYKLSKLAAGNILSTVPLAMLVGSPLLGYLSDKVLVSRKQVLVGSAAIHCVCWVVMVMLHGSLSIPVLYILFSVMGIMSGAPGSVGFAATKELFPLSAAGTSIGAANLFAFAGGVILQPVVGYVLDQAGKIQGAYPSSAYKIACWVFFGASIAALAGAVFSRETIGRGKAG
jgi:sugar phosphate permease